MRPRSAGSESEALEVVVSFIVTGEGSGQGEGDDERTDFFPVFRRDPEAGCSSTLVSTTESTESVSTLDFLGARMSIPPIDRRFTEVFVGSQVVSTSKSDSGVDCLVSSSRIGEEERHVKGEERKEGDGDREFGRDPVRDAGRVGVCGIVNVSPGLTGDGGVTSGTVAARGSSQLSGMPV